jgi:hypothetical protein
MRDRQEVEVLNVRSVLSGNVAECVVHCLSGPIQVGDLMHLEEDRISKPFRILEIRYYQHLVRELETNFGGLITLEGDNFELLKAGSRLLGTA